MDFRKGKLEQRYESDATFHQAVQSMYKMISQFGLTPSELREAAFLAHYKYEMENPRVMENRVIASMINFMGLEDELKRDKSE